MGAKAKRKTITLPPGSKTPSQIAEQLQAQLKTPLSPHRVELTPKTSRKNSPLYDAGAKPAVDDPIGAIVYGNQSPDAVLAKVRIDGHVSHAAVKTSDRPIDYLRNRNAKPISSEQYQAAEQFLADHQTLANFGGSNTAAIIDHCSNAVPWTAADRKLKDAGDMMPYGSEVRIPVDKGDAIAETAFRVRRATGKLDGWERSVLTDLVIHDYPVGVIAQRWGVQPDAAGVLVRLALWKLVRVYEETSAEFRAWVIVERQMADQGG